MKTLVWLILINLGAGAFASESNLIDEPKKCFEQKQYPCAIRFLSWGQVIEVGQLKITSAKNSNLVVLNDSSVRILEGIFLIEGQETSNIDLGVLAVKTNGELWIEKNGSQKMTLASLTGEANVTSAFVNVADVIPAGYEKWYTGMNSKGKLEQGLASAIDLQLFLPQWNKLTALPKVQAQQKIKFYQSHWKGHVEAASQYYRELVGRQIASLQAREEARDQQLEREREERARLRQLFRQKNYINP